MANVDLIPTQARTVGSRWNLAGNALADDSQFAFCASGSAGLHYLVLENLTAGLPQDITIEGIGLTMKASTDVTSSTAHVGAFLSTTGKTNNALHISSTQYASALTTSEATYTLQGSSFLWNLSWRRPQIHGNSKFSIFLFPAGDQSVGRKIQYCYITVYYSLNTYLKGERSAFPPDMSLWPYNGATDSIPRKYNGSGSANQIKSEDVNLLGDCIYQLEKVSLQSSNLIRAEGGEGTQLSPQSLFAWTTTITGNWVGGQDAIYFHNTQRLQMPARTVLSNQTTTNLTNVRWTKPPILPFNAYTGIFMPMVQGTAWLTTGGVITPAHLTITTVAMRRVYETVSARQQDVMSTSIGWRISLGNNLSSTNQQVVDWAGTHYGHQFSAWTSYPSGCQVIVRLTGFAPIGA